MIRVIGPAQRAFAVRVALRFVAACAAILSTACAAPAPRCVYRELHMGCEARIVIASADTERAAHAARAAFDRIAALDQVLSDWNPESEISRLARDAPSPTTVTISDDLAHALRCALCVHAATDGRFDPALGALTLLWRTARSSRVLPNSEEIARAQAASGTRWLSLDCNRLTFLRADLRLDFGAIGKGLAADAALEVLARAGFSSALVELGGDLAVGDAPPGSRSWPIFIASTGEVIEVPPWSGIASSGDDVQHLSIDGARRSHIVDPPLGLGVRNAPRVTVLVTSKLASCPECGPGAMADALATALSVAGIDEATALLERFDGASALMIETEPERSSRAPVRLRHFPSATAPESPPDPANARRAASRPKDADPASDRVPHPR